MNRDLRKILDELKPEGVSDALAIKKLKALQRELAQDIREMKLLRARLGTTIRAAIETHLSLLEGLSQDDPEGGQDEDKVSYLTPPARAADAGEA